MGIYYIAEQVEEKGKYIGLSEKQPRLYHGMRLIAVLDKLLYKYAPDITSPDEYDHFYQQYASGQFVSMKVYQVPEDDLPDRSTIART